MLISELYYRERHLWHAWKHHITLCHRFVLGMNMNLFICFWCTGCHLSTKWCWLNYINGFKSPIVLSSWSTYIVQPSFSMKNLSASYLLMLPSNVVRMFVLFWWWGGAKHLSKHPPPVHSGTLVAICLYYCWLKPVCYPFCKVPNESQSWTHVLSQIMRQDFVCVVC